MNIINSGSGSMKPCKIDYRREESYYLFPEKDQVGFTVDVNLNSAEDYQNNMIGASQPMVLPTFWLKHCYIHKVYGPMKYWGNISIN